MKQRELMRQLYTNHSQDESAIVSLYAEAEKDGTVKRRSNKRNITAIEYAERLLADGKKKDWIYED